MLRKWKKSCLMALPCVLAFSQLHGAGMDSAPNVGSESSVAVQDCYINAFKAKIVPERIRSFAMPADGIVSNWIPAEGGSGRMPSSLRSMRMKSRWNEGSWKSRF